MRYLLPPFSLSSFARPPPPRNSSRFPSNFVGSPAPLFIQLSLDNQLPALPQASFFLPSGMYFPLRCRWRFFVEQSSTSELSRKKFLFHRSGNLPLHRTREDKDALPAWRIFSEVDALHRLYGLSSSCSFGKMVIIGPLFFSVPLLFCS